MFEIYKRPDHTEIIKNIVMDWAGFGLPQANLAKINCKIISPRKQGFNSLMTFMFYCNGEPLVVVKTSRYSESKIAVESLQNEALTLKNLAQADGLKDKVPHLYIYAPIAGVPTMITAAAKGKMLNEILDEEEDPSKLDALLTLGVQPAVLFAGVKGQGSGSLDQNFVDRHIGQPLKLVGEYYPQYIEMIERSVQNVLSAAELKGDTFNRCLAHNDFNPWNILLSADEKLTVIDWEDASFGGLPFMDFFNYYIVAHRILFIGENLYAKSRTADQKKQRTDVLVKNYRKNLEEYCKKTRIPTKTADLLFAVFASNISAFFLDEKRRSVSYSESWVSMLLDLSVSDCFEEFVKKLSGI